MIGARHGVQIATIAHAGDGNLHPLIITPAGDDAARAAAQAAFDELLDRGDRGGRHGDRRARRRPAEARRHAAASSTPGALAMQTAVPAGPGPARDLQPRQGLSQR